MEYETLKNWVILNFRKSKILVPDLDWADKKKQEVNCENIGSQI